MQFNTYTHTHTHHRRRLGHTLRIFCQAYNALQVSPAGGPHNEAFATNLERATKLFISSALLYSRRMDAAAGRDAMISTQEESWWASSTGWGCSRGEVNRKHGKIYLKLAEYEQES